MNLEGAPFFTSADTSVQIEYLTKKPHSHILYYINPVEDQKHLIEIPAQVVGSHNTFVLTKFFISSNFYNPIRDQGFRSISGVLRLKLYSNGESNKVENLSSPVRLSFPMNLSIPSLKNIVEAVFTHKTTTQKEVIQNQDIQCLFYDEASQQLSGEGCEVAEFSSSEIVCACTHLTDFMTFVKGSYEPLLGSNYKALAALTHSSWSTLKVNLGVRVSGALLGVLILLLLLHYFTTNNTNPKEKMVILALEFSEAQSSSKYQYQTDNSKQIYSRSMQTSEVISQSPQVLSNPSTIRETKQTPPPRGFFSKLHHELLSRGEAAKQESKRCCCCVLCFKLMAYDLKSYNQLYQIILSRSLFISRSVRLLFFFLGIHLQLALCALFYDLDGGESEVDFTTEGLISNFWISVICVLFTLPLLTGISCCFQVRRKSLQRLHSISSLDQFEHQLNSMLKSMKCKFVCGWVLFWLISCFCFLYIIAFCEMATQQAQEEWFISSGLSILVDLVAFQILPAILVSGIGLLTLGCKMKCGIYLLVLIEGYRAIRSFVGF